MTPEDQELAVAVERLGVKRPGRDPALLEVRRYQERARGMVRQAVKTGRIQRPTICSRCGKDPGLGKDGRSLIHAHHHAGYDQPLNVEWLCVYCHRAETPTATGAMCSMIKYPGLLAGTRNGNAKLTEDASRTIRRRLADGVRGSDLASGYGVSRNVISAIKNGRAWKHTIPTEEVLHG